MKLDELKDSVYAVLPFTKVEIKWNHSLECKDVQTDWYVRGEHLVHVNHTSPIEIEMEEEHVAECVFDDIIHAVTDSIHVVSFAQAGYQIIVDK